MKLTPRFCRQCGRAIRKVPLPFVTSERGVIPKNRATVLAGGEFADRLETHYREKTSADLKKYIYIFPNFYRTAFMTRSMKVEFPSFRSKTPHRYWLLSRGLAGVKHPSSAAILRASAPPVGRYRYCKVKKKKKE